jgi:uncharacterized repeat protein (TIGR03803 family)
LVFDTAGNLYGTTYGGGSSNDGTVFELSPGANGWTEKVLHNFRKDGTDGVTPEAGVIIDAAGNLYGTAARGGSGLGIVFELSPDAGGNWTEKVLHAFQHSGDGGNPAATLTLDAGNLYGTTEGGVTGAYGSAFMLTPQADGTWSETVLHLFSPDGSGMNAVYPSGGLILDSAGNLYGATYDGGTGTGQYCGFLGCGTVYQLTPAAGGTWTETILHSFMEDGKDGFDPQGNLIFGRAGNLYGITYFGGTGTCSDNNVPGCGTVFEVKP